EVVVKPRPRRETDDAAEDGRVSPRPDLHEAVAESVPQLLPVAVGKVVERRRVQSSHRLFVENGEGIEAVWAHDTLDFDPGLLGLADESPVVAVHTREEISVERPGDRRLDPVPMEARRCVLMIREEGMEAYERGDDRLVPAPVVVRGAETFERRIEPE